MQLGEAIDRESGDFLDGGQNWGSKLQAWWEPVQNKERKIGNRESCDTVWGWSGWRFHGIVTKVKFEFKFFQKNHLLPVH